MSNTERVWLACRRPGELIDFLTQTPGLIYKTVMQSHPHGRRKLRLFGVATARGVPLVASDPKLREAVDAAEMFADGHGTRAALELKAKDIDITKGFPGVLEGQSREYYRAMFAHYTREDFARMVAYFVCAPDAHSSAIGHKYAALSVGGEGMEVEAARQADLLRDIFGNPFRPVVFAREWRTSTVKALAAQMYESRDFSTMPILADALQDAGCDSDDILNHCRDTAQVHVRGCWVVDLVLGKS